MSPGSGELIPMSKFMQHYPPIVASLSVLDDLGRNFGTIVERCTPACEC
jgi:hypothetical protein